MKVAVAFLSFDRFQLVKVCLNRIVKFIPKDWPLKVFQDGWVDTQRENVGSANNIRRALDLFSDYSIDVQSNGEINRGVAEIVFEAESWAFEQVSADCLILLEDDIFISKHFFSMMSKLSKFAVNNERIGAFSAYGDSSRSYTKQFLMRNQFVPMHHRWGGGISRNFWLGGRSDYVRYLSLMRGIPYRHRPHDKISEFLKGFKNAHNVAHITSQDGAHTAIMLHHGGFSVMPPTSYAVNVGKSGLHSYPSFYRQNRAQMRGQYSFFPLPVNLSEVKLREQNSDLYEKSVNFQYW